MNSIFALVHTSAQTTNDTSSRMRMRYSVISLPLITLPLIALFMGGCNGGSHSGKIENDNGESAHGVHLVNTKTAGTELKTLKIPMRTDGPKTLDPIRGSTTYDNEIASQIYETLLQYRYLKRPLELEPLLLAEMPTVSEDGLTYSFTLRDDINFADDPCFTGGKGRKLTSDDVFYSWKRMADNSNSPKAWWLYKNTIKGFDHYRTTQNDAVKKGGKFNYATPVSGMQIIDKTHFKVVLEKPVTRFLWLLAMFQTAVLPVEAVETYGAGFGRHPVGTGPYILAKESDWTPAKKIILSKNPNYRESYYPAGPDDHMPEDVAKGLTHTGQKIRLPIIDKIEIEMFVEDQPMWLEFQSNKLGFTKVPDEYQDEAFSKRSGKLKSAMKKRGIRGERVPMLDFIFRGFNMEDKLLGGYGPKKKALRQAIALALDFEEQNDTFYHANNIVYDGVIPPGLDGYPTNGKSPKAYRGPDLERARKKLTEAGYPEGKGLPTLDYYTSQGGNSSEQAEMMTRQLGKIGIKLNVNLVNFSTLIEAINNKKAPYFSFAWGSDYPDGENNLALFYSPNASPGSNHYNYKNLKYDKLYEKILTMVPSPERTKIYQKMNEILLEDVPYIGSMARTRNFLISPWLKNYKPGEGFSNWYKYLDISSQ